MSSLVIDAAFGALVVVIWFGQSRRASPLRWFWLIGAIVLAVLQTYATITTPWFTR